MLLYAGSAVRLKCALGHRNALLILKENLCHGGKYLVYLRLGQESSRGGGAPLSRDAAGHRGTPGELLGKTIVEVPCAASHNTEIRMHVATIFSAFTIDGATEKRIDKLL
jgi:hypothetical protein